jgi:tRNA U55 pseudouridine synthase TruB
VTALRRTRSGPFAIGEAQPLAAVLDTLAAGKGALPAVSLAAALTHLEQRAVSDEVARDLRMGRKLGWQTITGRPPEAQERLSLLDGAGGLVAVAEPRSDGTIKTLRVFRCLGADASEPRASTEVSA